ncbi:MAG: response regulator transcription factor [Sedimentisphaerales bacterium]|nr:response regulator transcription factor [Sedimentisphaerales bacterium]
MQESERIRVLLAEDHAIVREGLRSLLEKQPEIEIVCDAEDGRIAVDRVRELEPDVVIMDITMPNLNGVEATRQITNEFPQIKIIALSVHSNRIFVADMLEAGASGYVLKECLFDELVQAIQAVIAGKTYLSSRITGVVVEDYIKRLVNVSDSPLSSLTSREREVLQLVAEGKSTKEIALELHVSTKTIDAGRRKIMGKLNANNVVDLVKIAIVENLVSFDLGRVTQQVPSMAL